MDMFTGQPRFTFEMPSLMDGLGLIPVIMGLFGVTEILFNVEQVLTRTVIDQKIGTLLPDRREWKASIKPILRGIFIGSGCGILPGAGVVLSTFASYAVERRCSKHPERFGHGAIEGVAGPETANNAAAQCGFIPLFTLGIPANVTTAILLGALMLFGVKPGPMLISSNPELFWGVVASMYVGNVMLLILNLPLIPMWVKVLKIPYAYLYAGILVFCLIGAYSINNSPTDVIIMIVAGILGYFLREFRYELAPFILAFVLEPIMEPAFRRSLIMSKGSFGIFLTHPISAVFIIIACVVFILPLITKRRLGEGLERED